MSNRLNPFQATVESTVQSCERSSFLTCLSLSFAFPLPHTREDVTSRGMTEIWCSGMFIPVERSVERGVGGDSHTHVQSESRSQWHDGPDCYTCDTQESRAERRG